jgi:hypothetical protein
MFDTIALLAVLAQNVGVPQSVVQRMPVCGLCMGHHSRHASGIVQFCVPFGMNYRRMAGFEGDIRDIMTVFHKKETAQLIIQSSQNPFNPDFRKPPILPPDAVPISVKDWRCDKDTAHDVVVERQGGRSRLVTFPFGYALYRDLPMSLASRFDRVLDSICCHPLP